MTAPTRYPVGIERPRTVFPAAHVFSFGPEVPRRLFYLEDNRIAWTRAGACIIDPPAPEFILDSFLGLLELYRFSVTESGFGHYEEQVAGQSLTVLVPHDFPEPVLGAARGLLERISRSPFALRFADTVFVQRGSRRAKDPAPNYIGERTVLLNLTDTPLLVLGRDEDRTLAAADRARGSLLDRLRVALERNARAIKQTAQRLGGEQDGWLILVLPPATTDEEVAPAFELLSAFLHGTETQALIPQLTECVP